MAEDVDDIDESNGSFNASDPVQVAGKRRAAGRKKKADEDVVYTLMSTQAGRAWIYSLLSDCHCFSTSFTGEALSSAFREGERNVGNRLTAMLLKTASKEFILMLEEHNKHDGK